MNKKMINIPSASIAAILMLAAALSVSNVNAKLSFYLSILTLYFLKLRLTDKTFQYRHLYECKALANIDNF